MPIFAIAICSCPIFLGRINLATHSLCKEDTSPSIDNTNLKRALLPVPSTRTHYQLNLTEPILAAWVCQSTNSLLRSESLVFEHVALLYLIVPVGLSRTICAIP